MKKENYNEKENRIHGVNNASNEQATSPASNAESGVEAVELKVWSPADEEEIVKQQCETFAAQHPEYDITFSFENVENADSITQLKNAGWNDECFKGRIR